MTSIFLSYARGDDEPFVRRLRDDLVARGIDVWFDRVSMPSRMLTFHQEIRDAITASDLLLLVVGPKAATSDYVTQEWQYAYLVANKRVNPIVRLDGENPPGSPLDGYELIPEDLKLLHAEDFRNDDRYDEHLEHLVRQLNEPVAPVGKLVAVPELPPGYRAQPERLRALRDLLLIDLQKPVVVTGAAARVGLQGMGGIGKSVLASAMAHHPEVRRAFPDGVYWVRLGQHPRVEELQRELAKDLGGDGQFDSVGAGKEQLRGLLAEKAVLLILDDVWDRPVADAFNVVGPRSRILLTTRDAGLVTALASQENHYRVELPTLDEARAILAGAAQAAPDDLPAEADAVIGECGRLPLALALCGGMVQGGVSWQSVLEALRDHDLEFLSADHPDPQNEQHQNAWKAMDASVRVLPPEEQERFAELAVFAADTGTPLAAVATLWQHTGGLKQRQSEALLAKSVARSLVQRSTASDAATARFTLHDLLRHFASGIADRRFGLIAALHQRLLDAYAAMSPEGWASGPDDGYFLQHLCEHLVAAGKDDEAVELLLDAAWVERLVMAGLVTTLVDAYDLVLARARDTPNDGIRVEALRLVQGALRLSQHVLAPHPEELPSQLYGRLVGFGNPAIDRMLEGLRARTRRPWLRPATATLTAPGGPLIRTLAGHAYDVEAVAVTPDGKTVVSGSGTLIGSGDNTMKVWDLATGRELRTLKGHTDSVTSVVVTPDGKSIVSGSHDKTVRVWDMANGWELRTLAGHSMTVNAVAVTPDGKTIVSGSWDKTVRVWDLATGREFRTLTGHTHSVTSVVVTPDGRMIVSADDKTVRVWDMANGRELRTLEGHTDEVTTVAVTPDGTTIVSGSRDETVRVWDLATGQERHTLAGHTSAITAVAVTHDGKSIISGSWDNTVKVWDLETRRERLTLDGHTEKVTAVAVTPDGKIIVSGSWDNTVKVWDLATGRERRTFAGHAGEVSAVAVTSDGMTIVSASNDATVKVWDLESGRELCTLAGHALGVKAVAVTPDGKSIVSGSFDNTVKIWDLETGRGRHTLDGHTDWVNAVAVTPDGRMIVSGSDDKTVKVWDLETGRHKQTLTGRTDRVVAVAVTPDGRTIVSGSGGLFDHTLKVWDLGIGWQLRTLFGHTGPVSSVAVTPDGRTIVSGSGSYLKSMNATVKVWDLETGQELRTLIHTHGVSAVAVTPDGRMIVSADDKTVRVWDLATGAPVTRFSLDAEINTCAASGPPDTIVVGDSVGRVHILRFEN